MAITSKKTKNRLDYGSALNDALFNKQVNDKSDNEKTSDEEHITSIATHSCESLHESSANLNNENLIQESIEHIKNQIKNENEDSSLENNFEINKDSFSDEDDAIFLAITKGMRGVQRSVYFESDVYQYLQAKSEKYNAKFSNVVNLLLKEIIYKK